MWVVLEFLNVEIPKSFKLGSEQKRDESQLFAPQGYTELYQLILLGLKKRKPCRGGGALLEAQLLGNLRRMERPGPI